jgi:D-beta-D-heptose 7-phosphate kinase/D-beta-D-heptose 1-phosphate adenosyltransferase
MGEKILERELMKEMVESLKKEGKKIVFTNGCFELLHIGHVRYLQAARAEGDVLVVGVNSDYSVRQIKEPKRPVVAENERAEVLASLECVDFVSLFDEPDPLEIIRSLLPDVLVKGADWAEDAIVGRDVVEEHGGKVVRIPLTLGVSTTNIIERILTNYRE